MNKKLKIEQLETPYINKIDIAETPRSRGNFRNGGKRNFSSRGGSRGNSRGSSRGNSRGGSRGKPGQRRDSGKRSFGKGSNRNNSGKRNNSNRRR